MLPSVSIVLQTSEKVSIDPVHLGKPHGSTGKSIEHRALILVDERGPKHSPHQRKQEMALGTWHLAHGTWHVDFGTLHLALGTCHGTWHLALGTWHLAVCIWHLALGTLHLALGTFINFEVTACGA